MTRHVTLVIYQVWKSGGGACTPPPPSACNRPGHSKCGMFSHLGEGRYKRIWCQKFKIFNFCQISKRYLHIELLKKNVFKSYDKNLCYIHSPDLNFTNFSLFFSLGVWPLQQPALQENHSMLAWLACQRNYTWYSLMPQVKIMQQLVWLWQAEAGSAKVACRRA